MNYLKSAFATICILSLVVFLNSCSGNDAKIKELEAQIDSLSTSAKEANLRYNDLSSFINEVSECVDSVSTQADLVMMGNPETGQKYSRAELRKRITDLGALIDRQRSRITSLVDSLNTKNINTQEIQRLTQLVNYLNEQLAAKEAEMERIQFELANSKKSIAELQTSVASAKALNEQLSNENSTLDQMITDKTNQLNQGWFMAKTKKELEQKGILSGGNLLKKAKFTPGAVNTSDCLPVDIRTFTQVDLNSKKKPQLLSQAPASSYIFEEVSKGKWKLIITDTMSFWSLSKIVVIQLQ